MYKCSEITKQKTTRVLKKTLQIFQRKEKKN